MTTAESIAILIEELKCCASRSMTYVTSKRILGMVKKVVETSAIRVSDGGETYVFADESYIRILNEEECEGKTDNDYCF